MRWIFNNNDIIHVNLHRVYLCLIKVLKTKKNSELFPVLIKWKICPKLEGGGGNHFNASGFIYETNHVGNKETKLEDWAQLQIGAINHTELTLTVPVSGKYWLFRQHRRCSWRSSKMWHCIVTLPKLNCINRRRLAKMDQTNIIKAEGHILPLDCNM